MSSALQDGMRRPRTLAVLLLAAIAGRGSGSRADDGFVGVLGGGPGGGVTLRTLHLVAEARLKDLLDDQDRLEASGVAARGKSLYVVFDDTTDVARVTDDLSEAEWIETDGEGAGYEGITWSPAESRFHCVIEAVRRDDELHARVATYDSKFALIDESWLRLPLPSKNKGFEGLAAVQRGGKTHLLALHEGDPEAADAEGGVRGRLEVFRQQNDGTGWKHVVTTKLPEAIRFADYSGVDALQDGRIAVVSQQSSALWIGRLRDDFTFADDGEVYLFPRDSDGGPRYSTIEGVTFLDAGRVACVTDLAKGGSTKRDRSIQIFALKAGAE